MGLIYQKFEMIAETFIETRIHCLSKALLGNFEVTQILVNQRFDFSLFPEEKSEHIRPHKYMMVFMMIR
jgi:hypothetical protein